VLWQAGTLATARSDAWQPVARWLVG